MIQSTCNIRNRKISEEKGAWIYENKAIDKKSIAADDDGVSVDRIHCGP